jgi:hypothetical protein
MNLGRDYHLEHSFIAGYDIRLRKKCTGTGAEDKYGERVLVATRISAGMLALVMSIADVILWGDVAKEAVVTLSVRWAALNPNQQVKNWLSSNRMNGYFGKEGWR